MNRLEQKAGVLADALSGDENHSQYFEIAKVLCDVLDDFGVGADDIESGAVLDSDFDLRPDEVDEFFDSLQSHLNYDGEAGLGLYSGSSLADVMRAAYDQMHPKE